MSSPLLIPIGIIIAVLFVIAFLLWLDGNTSVDGDLVGIICLCLAIIGVAAIGSVITLLVI